MAAAEEIDDEGYLRVEGGKKIPILNVGPATFIDRTIAIYGPSKTGKTVITKHIMKVVSNHIEQILIVAPSEPSNRTYAGIVDPPLIHYRLYLADPGKPKKDDGIKGGLRFLEAVWQRQEMMASIYTQANKLDVLASLYKRLSRTLKDEGDKVIKNIDSKRRATIDRVREQYATEPGRSEEKVSEITEKFTKMLTLLYKKFITLSHENLSARKDLSESERYSLEYLDFNPRLLLIFDDCAAQLKPYFSKEVFRLLFYQNRHSFITVIICCQDDTDLPTNLRKNAFLSFYTEPIVCRANFDRPSNNFPKATRHYVGTIVDAVFKGHRKLAYIREDDRRLHFYHVKFPFPKMFEFGSAATRELCSLVQSDGISMDAENPYFKCFKL